MNDSIIKWSPFSILVSTPRGLIRKICPFYVRPVNTLVDTGNKVTQVAENENGILLFEINGSWDIHSNWQIV